MEMDLSPHRIAVRSTLHVRLTTEYRSCRRTRSLRAVENETSAQKAVDIEIVL
jgi:hypothetical protein